MNKSDLFWQGHQLRPVSPVCCQAGQPIQHVTPHVEDMEGGLFPFEGSIQCYMGTGWPDLGSQFELGT